MSKTGQHRLGFWRIPLVLLVLWVVWIGYSFRAYPTIGWLIYSCRQNDARGIPAARKLLGSKSAEIRAAAARGLGVIGPRAKLAVPELLNTLSDDSPEAVASAAWAIGVINTEDASPGLVDAVLRVLEHPDREVRRYGAYALSLWGPRASAAVPALVKLLDDPWVAPTAAGALGEIGGMAHVSIPQIAKLLKSDSSGARIEAVVALAKLQPLPDEVISEARELLNDPDPWVREVARKTLTGIKQGSQRK